MKSFAGLIDPGAKILGEKGPPKHVEKQKTKVKGPEALVKLKALRNK